MSVYTVAVVHSFLVSFVISLYELGQFINSSDYGHLVSIFTCLNTNDIGFLAIY